MRSPSAAGVHELTVFFWCVRAALPGTDFDQSILPDLASTQTRNRSLASSDVDCRKTLPFETIGDECPVPGNTVLKRKFSGIHLAGMVLSSAVPVPLGPRKRGQSAALIATVL